MIEETLENTYCADFETTGQSNYNKDGYVRVYLWSLVSLTGKEYYGTSIMSFLEKIIELKAVKIYFHNLRFDGSFIIDYFARFKYVYGKDYSCIIDGLNTWYQISIYADYGEIKIWDSLKKFPNQSVESISKLYGIPGKKEKPNFDRYLPLDYKPYQEEIEYCVQDSRVIAYAINEEYKQGHNSMTLSSDAFKSVRQTLGGYAKWRAKMPKLTVEEDSFIRDSYKGGWVYVNPVYQNKELDDITVYDVNSLYPHVMHNCLLPYGSTIKSYKKPNSTYCYVVKFTCRFKLKVGYLPIIQIKHNPLYLETQYLTESIDEVELTLTNIDYDMFIEHYKVWNLKVKAYYVMKQRVGLLADYIDYWMAVKVKATETGNKAMRYIAKRYLNSPYGKTGMRIQRINKEPVLCDDGQIRFIPVEEETDGIYVPYASFVCSQARKITITGAQKHYKDFVYADTDSLHLLGNDHSGLEVDDVKLGAWKIEGKFEKGKYLRAKTYIHADKNYNVQEIKCAGMPDNIKAKCTWEQFKEGNEFLGKIMQKRVIGGVMLCPTTFKIKPIN